ncbi:Glycosyl hydrolase family 43 [Pyrenophora seminiperda CCB06]|uniref:Glycosyl hydrolase family 43 n=1 Tax=Pyrenophora seminiperda CCB06 TaxID=1302712 RepID=A0A3M7MB43_9PLEO|nr:Glycosyl hydrolase family 43 [Pyrenophora seminiperda CCB06]
MNRWLNRKKDGADDAAAAKKTKKGKKGQEEEPKPDFDLSAALPKTDDFRTSLIMPGLSTRFSMLREQNDPDSVIGKASDDSVLQPKRQSRLAEFGFVPGGLTDIAEVSSLNGSIRPFAKERTNSFDSSQIDDGSGSVMTRARPGEGNVLFGGRQKIYMISNTNSKGTGRTLYDDDVNMSAYQRLRQEEKERLRRQAEEDEERRSEPSSPTELSRKRETSSSTNSGTIDVRTSTAATSIASQGANSVNMTSPPFSPTLSSPDLSKSTTKRRLYDNGLDQQIQDQQSSAMSRLNSIQRARAPTGRSTPPIGQARSGTNLNDRFARGPGFRSDSPNALGYAGISRNNSGASSPTVNRSQSPALTSPVISESDESHTLNAALQPNDRGKATAMGAFNKPKEAFSEEQYAERLRHLQQDREVRETTTSQLQKSPSQKPSLRERAEQQRRNRAESNAKSRERSESSAEQQPASSAFSRFQAAASQMRTVGPGTPTSPPTPPPTQKLPALPSQDAQFPEDCSKSTFLASPNASDNEEETSKPPIPTRRYDNLPVATGPAPSMFEHPAFRSRTKSDEEIHRNDPAVNSPLSPQDSAHPNDSQKPSGIDVDSPTLGPETGGLSGMIRQHLRNVSNVSSNYGEPGPPLISPQPMGLAIQTQNFGLQRRQPGSESATPAPSTHSHSNPWDLDDIDNPYRDEPNSMTAASPVDGPRSTPLIMSATEPKSNDSWDLTPRRNHERIASNETEVEHEAFQRDLAQRQRLIQESLRAKAEGRSLSPAPGPSGGGLKNALNMLRAKSSHESFATVDVANKSARKLALGGGSANVSSISLVGQNRGDAPTLRSKPSRVLQQSEQDAQREHQHRQRSGTDSNRTGRPTGRTGPMSTRSSTRERSSSGTSSGHSRSVTDQYRDDLDQAMAEGSRGAYPANTLPSVPGYVANPTPPLPTERPSLDSQGRMRSRSNSKTTAANYFESKHLQPIQTNVGAGQNSRSPLQGKFSPGLPVSPRPSPGGFKNMSGNGYSQPTSPMPPFSANDTPPVSNPTTPSSAAFNPKTVQPFNKQGPLRKKSIAKSEIGEPVFISTTSVIDTVNLPPGASLKNGAEIDAPPVPPINPMRRRFGFGRGESQSPSNPSPYDPAVQQGMEALRAPYSEAFRSESSDAVYQAVPKSRLRKTTSEGKSLRGDGPSQSGPSPAMPQYGFTGRNKSPPRPINGQPLAQRPMEGGMF